MQCSPAVGLPGRWTATIVYWAADLVCLLYVIGLQLTDSLGLGVSACSTLPLPGVPVLLCNTHRAGPHCRVGWSLTPQWMYYQIDACRRVQKRFEWPTKVVGVSCSSGCSCKTFHAERYETKLSNPPTPLREDIAVIPVGKSCTVTLRDLYGGTLASITGSYFYCAQSPNFRTDVQCKHRALARDLPAKQDGPPTAAEPADIQLTLP